MIIASLPESSLNINPKMADETGGQVDQFRCIRIQLKTIDEAPGNNNRIYAVYCPEPCAEVLSRLNFNISFVYYVASLDPNLFFFILVVCCKHVRIQLFSFCRFNHLN